MYIHQLKLKFIISSVYCNRQQFPGDKERDSSDNNYEGNETSLQQSMECDSVIDVTEDDSSEQYDEQDQSEEHEDKNNMTSTSNTGKCLLTSVLSVTLMCLLV